MLVENFKDLLVDGSNGSMVVDASMDLLVVDRLVTGMAVTLGVGKEKAVVGWSL